MCLTPVLIKNRSRRYRNLIDPYCMEVPCGHCSQCQKNKLDSWFVRGYAEYKRVTSKGGFVLFPTLTYDNENLPKWKDDEFDFEAPVFDKSHFKSFRSKLRVYLTRAGYDCSGNNTIRYIYCTEYGEKKGRSHLHCLIFIPFKISLRTLKHFVRKSWIYGMVRYSSMGATLNSPNGILYTTKYMAKDDLWYQTYGVQQYLDNLKSNIKLEKDMFKKISYQKRLSVFKKCMPHHCQSTGFGSSLELTDDDFIKGTISSSKLGVYKKDKPFNYLIPQYYYRKYLYDFDKVEKIFTINERGIKIKQATFNNKIDLIDRSIADILYSDTLVNDIKLMFPDEDVSQFKLLTQLLSTYDSRDIAIYSLCYRHRLLYRNNFEDLYNLYPHEFLKITNEQAYFRYCEHIDNRDVPLCDDYLQNGAEKSFDCLGWSDCNIYKVFEDYLTRLEHYSKLIGELRNNASIHEHITQQKQFGNVLNNV